MPPPFMHSDDDHPAVLVRPMTQADRAIIAGSVVSVDNFNKAEVACALELVDLYLGDKKQADYRVVVAEDAASRVHAYACWDPVALTRWARDFHLIASCPDSHGRGFGRALMNCVEIKVLENGSPCFDETLSKASENTLVFSRRLGFEEASRIKDFYEVGDDRPIVVKRLS